MSTNQGAIPAVPRRFHRVEHFAELLLPTFEDMRAHAPVLPALSVVLACSVASAFGFRPFLAAAFTGEQSRSGDVLQVWLWLVAFASPLIALLKAGLFAAVAWAVAVLLSDTADVRRVVSVMAYGEIVTAAAGMVTVLALFVRGINNIAQPQDLAVKFGLDGVVAAHSPVMLAILAAATPFRLAWALFIWWGLQRVAGMSRGVAAAVVAILLIGTIATVAVRATFA